jgi:hypothetical protein
LVVWGDQECVDEFKASPDYAVFLISLGVLDLGEPGVSSSSSSLSSSGTIQTVIFESKSAANHMQGWISFHTVTLAYPATDEQRKLHRELKGPRYRCPPDASDQEFFCKMVTVPRSTRSNSLKHGWVQELRQIGGEEGGKAGTTVQDAFFYRLWLSKEAEEEKKRALPGVEYSWDEELRNIGAIEAKEEHVDMVPIAYGRSYGRSRYIKE